MVFCRECQRKVEDCEHFVAPIEGRRVRVFDEKVETIVYAQEQRILEIAFKSGQVWQLAGVPAGIYAELEASTISSFLKFIAQRYKASPVKTGIQTIAVPESEPCPRCQTPMMVSNKVENSLAGFVRIFWKCPRCEQTQMQTYRDRSMAKSDRKGSRWR